VAANTHVTPQLDESTFQQILQAAFIIQQQNDVRSRKRQDTDPATTLALIAETQELLQSKVYDLNAAAKLIVERLGKITDATGVAIALIASDELTFCAASGRFASLLGSTTPVGASVSEFLHEEETLHRMPNDARSDLLGKQDDAPAFFPIYCQRTIAALLQLTFSENESIQEHEIRSCQLMAGLMGEAISRAAEVEWKQSLAAERATMLEALERLRPQLERLAAESGEESTKSAEENRSNGADGLPPEIVARLAQERDSAIPADPMSDMAVKSALFDAGFSDIGTNGHLSSTCNNCGFQFSDEEKFCGRCGNRRIVDLAPSDHSPEAVTPEPAKPWDSELMAAPAHEQLPDAIMNVQPAVSDQGIMQFANDAPATEGTAALALAHQPAESELQTQAPKTELELVPEPEQGSHASPWTSASKARRWLHSLQQPESKWVGRHSGDVSVAVAALVLLLVLFGWNARPAPSKLAHGKISSQPSLTLFERMLIGLGLAEPPAAPIALGNPNAQVWEDLHTGLYYCPGDELYGKTPGGKVTNQRDAQLDQFEPAARKTCE
jgi:hypothetical protein